MNLARFILAAGLAGLLCGCGTLNNSIMMFYHQPPADPPADYQPSNWVYGGVKWDADELRIAVSKADFPLFSRLLIPFWIADIPLSAVCDTLNLPHTIPETQSEADWWRSIQAKRQDAKEMKPAAFDGGEDQSPVNVAAPKPDAVPESNRPPAP